MNRKHYVEAVRERNHYDYIHIRLGKLTSEEEAKRTELQALIDKYRSKKNPTVK